jgi:hypothetical protein
MLVKIFKIDAATDFVCSSQLEIEMQVWQILKAASCSFPPVDCERRLAQVIR